MTAKDRAEDPVPSGTCTALKCECNRFHPRRDSLMYCRDCGHSVEHHHIPAREIGR